MIEDYLSLERAFKFYNEKLFQGKLNPVAFTMGRKARMIGCYRPISFVSRQGSEEIAEIQFNPDYMDRTIEEVLSTLVHEMFHHAQHSYGNPGRPGYHNKEWGAWMDEAGLTPSSTGAEGGKRTGQSMSHYIAPGGLFETVTKGLVGDDFSLKWCSVVGKGLLGPAKAPKPRKKSKIKYSCPECQQNAWAKPNALLACGRCKCDLEAQEEAE